MSIKKKSVQTSSSLHRCPTEFVQLCVDKGKFQKVEGVNLTGNMSFEKKDFYSLCTLQITVLE